MGLDQVNEMLQRAIKEVCKKVGGGEVGISKAQVAVEGDRTFINREEIMLVRNSVQQVKGEYELVVNEKKQRMKREEYQKFIAGEQVEILNELT